MRGGAGVGGAEFVDGQCDDCGYLLLLEGQCDGFGYLLFFV
jgi:hypothetical protein